MKIAADAFKRMKQKQSKYRAVKTEYNGRLYDSKLEAAHARRLDELKNAGIIQSWVPQPSFPLVAERIRPDFMVVLFSNPKRTWGNAHPIAGEEQSMIVLLDSKGYDTPAGKRKRKAFKELYGLDVLIIGKDVNL